MGTGRERKLLGKPKKLKQLETALSELGKTIGKTKKTKKTQRSGRLWPGMPSRPPGWPYPTRSLSVFLVFFGFSNSFA